MNTAPVIVLGMHRSGTSCLTGSLEQAGLYLGEVNRKAPHNVKGNQENRDIMDLNDAVLSKNGAAWDAPPKSPTIWTDAHRDRCDQILATYPADQAIGFKDPRTVFTLEGWLEVLPSARLVGTFRHPLAVAQSLNTRNGIPLQQGCELWLSYNRRILEHANKHEMPMINFDLAPEHYLRGLLLICEMLHLTPATAGFKFFSAELRHNEPPQEPLRNNELREVYDALLQLSVHSS